jgi:hypothetical protein
MLYLTLAVVVIVAIGWGLVCTVGTNIGGCCSGNCNQGRNCDCKDKI